jgi:ankyrin repeat protein
VHAIIAENVPLIELLLERQVDVNARNADGRTPVFFAVMVKSVEILERLVAAGATLLVGDNYSHTPLYFARTLAEPLIERCLVDHGLTVSILTDSG